MESEYLFIYGIFRDIYRNLLGEAVFCGKAYVTGKIYKVDEFYPGYIDEGNTKVYGDVYLVKSSVFKDLDEFEGSEYTRRKIKTSIGKETWIYEYIKDVDKFAEVIGGDWLLR